ncbi:putative mitotic centromere-associated kinesin [Rosellinia necatrix]|uniref:Kinesin-like protein n=1 Tax=Rosellinia necatrix TaxID=77044 RepID=A0A1S7UJG1_ROSNE|nr:putative mitotic centromere-associated kinesin [Rosellinia necatrix]
MSDRLSNCTEGGHTSLSDSLVSLKKGLVEQPNPDNPREALAEIVHDRFDDIGQHLDFLVGAAQESEFASGQVALRVDLLVSHITDGFRTMSQEMYGIVRSALADPEIARRRFEDRMEQSNANILSALTQLNTRGLAEKVALEKPAPPEKPAAPERRIVLENPVESISKSAEVQAKLKAQEEEIKRLRAALASTESRQGSEDAEFWKKSAEQLEESLKAQMARQEEITRSFTARYRDMVSELATAKGAIRIICRIKPEDAPTEDLVECTNPDQDQSYLPWTKLRVAYQNDSKKTEERDFQFQRVFGSGETNKAIFDEVKDVAQSAIFGKACTVMAYGATGTGKSYTFLSDDGLVQRYIGFLFEMADDERDQHEYEFHLSAVEIYLNKIYDLLQAPKSGQKTEVRLNYESWTKLDSQEEAVTILRQTIDRREAASTKQNATSSRSHFIISLRILKKPCGSSDETLTAGVINFIDLAGSEAAAKNFMMSGSGAQQSLIYEQGQDINKGLLDLGQGIRNLATKGKFFPGHNLTRALRSSLSPGSRLLLVATVSPHTTNQSNTLNTLRWSQDAIGVRNESPRGKAAVPAKTPNSSPSRTSRTSVSSSPSSRTGTVSSKRTTSPPQRVKK